MKEFLARWMPIDASAHGAELDNLNALVHWLMAIMFVGWSIYFIYVLFRFRRGRNPEASYAGAKSHFSTYTEVGVVVVEVLLLVAFAIPAWARYVTPHAEEANTLTVRVVGEQFLWNMHYPGADGVFGRTDVELVDTATNPLGIDRSDPAAKDDITSLNTLHLPVDRPITVLLSSKDVIHSFSLPTMRVKQDAIPGLEIPIHFRAVMTNEEESWEIACAQLCGLGHYRMRGFLKVHSQADFAAWEAAEVAKLKG